MMYKDTSLTFDLIVELSFGDWEPSTGRALRTCARSRIAEPFPGIA